MEYHPVHTQQQLVSLFLENEIYSNNQFVEALVYSSEKSVFMIGNMTDEAEPDKVKFTYK